MNGAFIAILTQALLLFGTSTGFNQPSSINSPDYADKISTETIRKDLNFKPGGLILLDTEYGNIKLEEYSGSEVRIELKLRGTAEGISNFKFTHNYFADQLTLKGWYDHTPGSRIADLTGIEFIVLVPKGRAYAISARTKQGNIEALVSRDMKCVDLSTEAGKVHVALPSDMSASVDASTSGLGAVSLNSSISYQGLRPKYEVNSVDHMKFKINGGKCVISAYSGIGSVYFELTSPKHKSQT